ERAIEIDSRMAKVGDMTHLVSELGFGRISFGVQDLDLTVGNSIGRIMDPEHLVNLAIEAREAGATGINVDLLYGLPRQSSATIAWTMRRIEREMVPARMALYGYAHVSWMRPQQRRLERAGLPGPAERLELFLTGLRCLSEAGYVAVGMDHFVKPEDSMRAARQAGTLNRKFMGYTTTDEADLMALGASSIGQLTSGSQSIYIQNEVATKPYERALGGDAPQLATTRGYIATPEDVLRGGVIKDILFLRQIAMHFDGYFQARSESPNRYSATV
ncbi:MAG: oxygen-independent coproporphyrinogen-3 oxidase, partial [Myxococcota bacterium]